MVLLGWLPTQMRMQLYLRVGKPVRPVFQSVFKEWPARVSQSCLKRMSFRSVSECFQRLYEDVTHTSVPKQRRTIVFTVSCKSVPERLSLSLNGVGSYEPHETLTRWNLMELEAAYAALQPVLWWYNRFWNLHGFAASIRSIRWWWHFQLRPSFWQPWLAWRSCQWSPKAIAMS